MTLAALSATPVGGKQSGNPASQGAGFPSFGQIHKIAILIDGEWLRRELEICLNPRHASVPSAGPSITPAPHTLRHGITAAILYKNAISVIKPLEEECFRIFYYDAEPFDGIVTNPIDGTTIDFSATPAADARRRFFRELGAMDLVALRRGECRARGWQIKENFLRQRIRSGNPSVTLDAHHIFHGFEQKGVDMRIGMDVATLSLKKLVDRIIIISGDTDLIPALKLARREGLQVGVVKVATSAPHAALVEDSDFVRTIIPST